MSRDHEQVLLFRAGRCHDCGMVLCLVQTNTTEGSGPSEEGYEMFSVNPPWRAGMVLHTLDRCRDRRMSLTLPGLAPDAG
jgi:hypothetical protein